MPDRRRRHDDEEHENHERWLITYADMITLLLALFMMLYALSVLDLQKFQAFREAFNNGAKSGVQTQGLPQDKNPPQGDPKTEVPGATPAQPARAVAPHTITDKQAADKLKQRLEKAIAKAGLSRQVSVALDARGVVVFVTDGVLFSSGEATLQPQGGRLLGGLVPVLAGVGNELEVEGHTDDQPIATDRFPSNWDLSTSRATTVLRTLLASPDISGQRVHASGFADTRPRVKNDSDAHRAVNRRVEIVVLVPSAPVVAPAKPAQRAGGPGKGGAAPRAPAAAPGH